MADLPLAQPRLALFDNPAFRPTAVQRAGLALVAVGGVAGVVALASDLGARYPVAFSVAFLGGLGVGGAVYALGGLARSAGVHNEGTMFSSNEARGAVAWTFGLVLTGLYVVLYFWPGALGGLVPLGSPLSQLIREQPATLENGGQWFLYSTLYTLAVLVMGVRALVRYRHSRYHVVRTLSVVFFQTVLAFAMPYLLVRLQEPELYLHYTWPLDYDLFFPWKVAELREAGQLGVAMVAWGVALIAVVTPVLTYFFGKRWYCSWVCGCGGLAETAGDPYRHLSDKSLGAWKLERWLVHGVLATITLGTALLWVAAATNVGWLDGVAGDVLVALRAPHRVHLRRRRRRRVLPGLREPRVVPVRVPDGGGPGPPAAVLLALPHHDERGAVHLVRPVLGVLRDGDRREVVRAAGPERGPRVVRGVRHLRDRLPARRAPAGERAGDERGGPGGAAGQQPDRGPRHPRRRLGDRPAHAGSSGRAGRGDGRAGGVSGMGLKRRALAAVVFGAAGGAEPDNPAGACSVALLPHD